MLATSNGRLSETTVTVCVESEYVEESSHLLLLNCCSKVCHGYGMSVADMGSNDGSVQKLSLHDGATLLSAVFLVLKAQNRPAEQIYIADHPDSTVVLYQISCH